MARIIALLLSFIFLMPEVTASEPSKFLWAWKRPENFSFIDPTEFGVAYLACHVFLRGNDCKPEWRLQEMHVPPHTAVVPVVRIDIDHRAPCSLSQSQIESLAKVIARAASPAGVTTVQIDFDALQSERSFYRNLLRVTCESLPRGKGLSITALASWCLFDDWISNLPVSESVPMMFSLGRDRAKVLGYFAGGADFRVGQARQSIGLSIEEPDVWSLMIPVIQRRTMPSRIYIFTRTAWNAKKLESVKKLLGESK